MFSLEKAKYLWSLFPPEAQDMSFAEFYKELCDMENPQRMQNDLMDMQLMRAQERSTKLRIDRALSGERNE